MESRIRQQAGIPVLDDGLWPDVGCSMDDGLAYGWVALFSDRFVGSQSSLRRQVDL